MALLDLLKFNDDHGDVNSLAGSFVKFGGSAAIHPIQLAIRERAVLVERVELRSVESP